jgi:hypothetical protein
MATIDDVDRAKSFLIDLTQSFSRRLFRSTLLTVCFGAAVTVTNFAYAGSPPLVKWPGCPPGPQAAPYCFQGNTSGPCGTAGPLDLWPAHFQTSPVAGPSGGNCSLDVVSGQVVSIANSAGGFAFNTLGEVAGAAYTISFDMQWVSGKSPWSFANEEGNGILNSLSFFVPYPGDDCWHHYEHTAAVGPNGPKTVMFVYVASPGPQEMRIANVILAEAAPGAAIGLVTGRAEGDCCKTRVR